jgi:hypothetical protein
MKGSPIKLRHRGGSLAEIGREIREMVTEDKVKKFFQKEGVTN